MSEHQKLVEETEGEEYFHEDVWCVVQRQIEYAEANSKGALYDDLTAMIFAFHAIEGYLNYLGEKIAHDVWCDEKTEFKGNNVTGKLAVLCERCGLAEPNYGKRPYSTIVELKKLRNAVVHPKTRKINCKVEYSEHKPPPLFRKSYLSEVVSHCKAIRARDDVNDIADKLHTAAREKFPKAQLTSRALGGIMALYGGTTRRAKI